MAEDHLLIIWSAAGEHKDAVLGDLISSPLQVVRVVDRTWPNPEQSLSRFYGQNLPGGSNKGLGQFRVVLVRDPQPEYQVRHTTKGDREVNVNIFDRKKKYRKWAGGGSKVHGTDTLVEAERDLALLRLDVPDVADPTIQTDQEPLAGEDEWRDLEEFFLVIGLSLKYVVLRNFEPLPKEFTVKGHGDIDLLVSRLDKVRLMANSEPVFPQAHRVHDRVRIAGKRVPFDFRFVGDDYYCKGWQKDLLDTRIQERGFWRPNDEQYFYSLLYHALVHKKQVKADYIERLTELGDKIGTPFTADKALPLLKEWMHTKGYPVVKAEPSVGFNRENVAALR